MSEYRDKLRSLAFVGQRVPSKVTVDHTDTAIVRTTEKAESQDVHLILNDAVRPHREDMTKAYADRHKEPAQ